MGQYSNEINSLAKFLTGEEITLLCEKWIEEQERWDNYNPVNKFYLEDGSFGDLFLHEIQLVEPSKRLCFVVDLSIFSRPVRTINYLPVSFPTQKEAIEYYSKKYPSFF